MPSGSAAVSSKWYAMHLCSSDTSTICGYVVPVPSICGYILHTKQLTRPQQHKCFSNKSTSWWYSLTKVRWHLLMLGERGAVNLQWYAVQGNTCLASPLRTCIRQISQPYVLKHLVSLTDIQNFVVVTPLPFMQPNHFPDILSTSQQTPTHPPQHVCSSDKLTLINAAWHLLMTKRSGAVSSQWYVTTLHS